MRSIPLPAAPSEVSCCTCVTPLSAVPRMTPGSEKPLPEDRTLDCCDRVICGHCIYKNARFAQYCPYCQTSTSAPALYPPANNTAASAVAVAPTAPPASKEKPSRDLLGEDNDSDPPPPYSPPADPSAPASGDTKPSPSPSSSSPPAPAAEEDTLHFLDHAHDTLSSLSLAYGVPLPVLRRANNLTSDHLLAGRRAVRIPASHYHGGVSLRPRPVEGEAEEHRKGQVRRFMVGCKVSDYDVATLYLEQAGYDLALATERFRDDEAWERANPNPNLDPSVGAHGRGRGRGGGLGLLGSRHPSAPAASSSSASVPMPPVPGVMMPGLFRGFM